MNGYYSTDSVRARERTAYWQEVVCDTFVPLDCRFPHQDAFRGSLDARSVADLSCVRVSSSAQRVTRTRRRIARGDGEYVLVGLALRGRSRVIQDDREAGLSAGDFVLYDTRRPYQLRFDGEFEQQIVQLPCRQLERRLGPFEGLTARAFSRADPLGRLTFDFLRDLGGISETLDSQTQERVAGQGLDLLATALARWANTPLLEDAGRNTLLLRIKRYLDAHLGDADLGPARVAAAFEVTPRYINQLLHHENTSLGRYIMLARLARLARCAGELADPAFNHRQIAEIAYRWGFQDPAHFSRRFRDHYGVSPRAYRAGQRGR
tara:strand:+ start:4456 stop:5418 length:963 start_codon:yes stop_codon:yes gene_type:complete